MPKVGEQIEKGGRRLQPQQQKFLDNYIHKDMTQTGAARAAGGRRWHRPKSVLCGINRIIIIYIYIVLYKKSCSDVNSVSL